MSIKCRLVRFDQKRVLSLFFGVQLEMTIPYRVHDSDVTSVISSYYGHFVLIELVLQFTGLSLLCYAQYRGSVNCFQFSLTWLLTNDVETVILISGIFIKLIQYCKAIDNISPQIINGEICLSGLIIQYIFICNDTPPCLR